MATTRLLLRWLAVATLVWVPTGCSGDGNEGDRQPEPGGSSAPESSSAPVERWRGLSDAEQQAYRTAAGGIDPALDAPELLDLGVALCQGMFEVQPDEDLIDLLQSGASDRLGVELSPAQAAQLIHVTNDHVCPDLAR